jgi:hypothetical protein
MTRLQLPLETALDLGLLAIGDGMSRLDGRGEVTLSQLLIIVDLRFVLERRHLECARRGKSKCDGREEDEGIRLDKTLASSTIYVCQSDSHDLALRAYLTDVPSSLALLLSRARWNRTRSYWPIPAESPEHGEPEFTGTEDLPPSLRPYFGDPVPVFGLFMEFGGLEGANTTR